MRNKSGFTIVEVLIVVVIVAILATLSVVTYTKIQADSRDSDRASKVSLIAGELEKYYSKNGEYPSCSAMTQAGGVVVQNVLTGINATVLVAPSSSAGTTNSIICTALTAGAGDDQFAYVGDGSTTCNTGAACLKYTLQYREESTGEIKSVDSLHSASISTTVTPVLTATTSGNTQIDISWTGVDSAVSYRYQQATDSAFTTGLVEATTSNVSSSITGLTPGATYYFRVVAVAVNGEGAWSNIANATTTISAPAAAPTMSAAMSGTDAIGTASVVTCASGTPQYQIQYRSTATATMGSWSAWSSWATGNTMTQAASQGYQYGFEAQARCYGVTAASAATAVSNIATVTRAISTPAAPTWSTPASFKSNVYAIVNYNSSCPSGTNRVNATFRTVDWLGGAWGPHNWGYNDSWENTSGVNKTVKYYGKYRCQTTYSTSAYTSETYTAVTVTP
jgi:prepilin-type N-terminal cleavage/methylation domain-containing protein